MRGGSTTVGLVAVVAALAAGCGGEVPRPATSVGEESSPTAQPYEGPLLEPAADGAEDGPEDLLAASGAAGRALDCDGAIYLGGSTEVWSKGDGGESPEEGLASFFEIEQPTLPRSGYHAERLARDRVLFSYDVDGETKIAVMIAKDQPRRPDWGPGNFAACDPAELPASFTDRLVIEIWTDRDGNRVPTTKVQSAVGPAHCNWETSHFVSTDAAGQPATFARDPERVLPSNMLAAQYDEDAAMPGDARDTGYRLGDWGLWAVPGAAMIFMRTPNGVEAWPAVKDGMGCA
jgi:hypothetical protein